MSIILDALRRGRARHAPGQHRDTAQTDAVLQTLGYGRFNPATPLNRFKRLAGYTVMAAVVALLLWAAVIWLTQALLPASAPENRAPRSQPAPPPARAPQTAQLVPQPPPRVEPAKKPETPPAPSETARAEPALPQPHTEPRPNASAAAPVASRMNRPPASSKTEGETIATVTAGEDHFGRALMYQRLGDFENALVSYREVLQRDEVNVEAHNNLGVLYRDKGLYDEAIRHFQRAIAIDPRYARARNNLGVVYLAQRRFDTAATQFHAALSIDPRNVEALVNLSTVDKESQRRDEARSSLTRALEIDPRSAEAHYNLGLLEDEAGDAPRALTHYRAFLLYGSAAHPALVGEVRKRIDALWPK
jgi:Tfp pilus assembly protein PilF